MEVGGENLKRFFSQSLPLLGERERPLMAAAVEEVCGRHGRLHERRAAEGGAPHCDVGGIADRVPVRAGHAATAGDVGQYAPMPTLVVRDQGQSISISFNDLLKYHGRSSIAGLAHAFKAMERAFPLLSPDLPPERYDITVESGFPGGGARDAFEMVTRAVTGDRYQLTVEARPGVPEAPGGHFIFRLGYRGTLVELTLRDGLVPKEFLDIACKEGPTPAEADRAKQLKEEIAEGLLRMRPEEVYDVATVG